MVKKSQAAMEFIMTYSWAIIISIIVIGVLAAWGLLNYEQLVPSRCIGAVNLPCIKKPVLMVNEDIGKSRFSFIARNPMPEKLMLDTIEASGTDSCNILDATVEIDNVKSDITGVLIEQGREFIINVYCANAIHDISKHEFTLKYHGLNEEFSKSSSFDIIAKPFAGTEAEVALP